MLTIVAGSGSVGLITAEPEGVVDADKCFGLSSRVAPALAAAIRALLAAISASVASRIGP